MEYDLNTLLGKILLITNDGYLRLDPYVRYFLTIFSVFTLTYPFLIGVLKPDFDPLSTAIGKVIAIGFFTFFITNWSDITAATFLSFAHLGIVAGGGSIEVKQFMDPSGVFVLGVARFQALIEQAASLTGVWSIASNVVDLIILLVAAFGILGSFFFIGLEIFMTIVTFELVMLLSLPLLPFGVFQPTSWVAQRVFLFCAGATVKVFMLALVFSLGDSLLQSFRIADDMTIYDAMLSLAAAITFAVLAHKAPDIANSFLFGHSPSFSTTTANLARVFGSALQSAGPGAAARYQQIAQKFHQVKNILRPKRP